MTLENEQRSMTHDVIISHDSTLHEAAKSDGHECLFLPNKHGNQGKAASFGSITPKMLSVGCLALTNIGLFSNRHYLTVQHRIGGW